MKLGYPCINRSIEASCSRTFRLASFNEERFLSTVKSNLQGLQEILEWNFAHDVYFFRISSQLIPFASHRVCTIDWQNIFKKELLEIGEYIKKTDMRISMHPDQYVLINSLNETTYQNSIQELAYHAAVLDAMALDMTAKIQIHVGGAYGDKAASMQRFVKRYETLPQAIKRRLVIENDDRLFTVRDCLYINEYTNIPVLFDNLHHEIHNNGESVRDAMALCVTTWRKTDGILMIDYSQQETGARIGRHSERLEVEAFKKFLFETNGLDADIMFEIKDKETSALKARVLF